MIYYQDYKIEIGFTPSGEAFWTMFRKEERHHPNPEEFEMMSRAFGNFKKLIDKELKKWKEKHGME